MEEPIYIKGIEVDRLYRHAGLLMGLDWSKVLHIFGHSKAERAKMWPMLVKRLEAEGIELKLPKISERRRSIMAQKARKADRRLGQQKACKEDNPYKQAIRATHQSPRRRAILKQRARKGVSP
jgi:hypothetical protein